MQDYETQEVPDTEWSLIPKLQVPEGLVAGMEAEAVVPIAGGYTSFPVEPSNNSIVPARTTAKCSKWHVAEEGDSCVAICLSSDMNIALFVATNPSLGTNYAECSGNLVSRNAYCTGPTYDWDDVEEL